MPLFSVSVTCYDETLNLHTCHQSLLQRIVKPPCRVCCMSDLQPGSYLNHR